jgi:hypothetical protein
MGPEPEPTAYQPPQGQAARPAGRYGSFGFEAGSTNSSTFWTWTSWYMNTDWDTVTARREERERDALRRAQAEERLRQAGFLFYPRGSRGDDPYGRQHDDSSTFTDAKLRVVRRFMEGKITINDLRREMEDL